MIQMQPTVEFEVGTHSPRANIIVGSESVTWIKRGRETAPPRITAKKRAELLARFDAKDWDATADADRVAEQAAQG